jgi:uncharacterized membrane protein
VDVEVVATVVDVVDVASGSVVLGVVDAATVDVAAPPDFPVELLELPHPTTTKAATIPTSAAAGLILTFSAILSRTPSPMSDSTIPTRPAEPPADDEDQRLVARILRWDPYIGPQLVVGAAILLQLSLPDKVTIGPAWLLPALEGVLLVGLFTVGQRPTLSGRSKTRRKIAIALIAFVSAANIVSLVLLCRLLVDGSKYSGRGLILAGAVLWLTNVLLFSLWYWELDRGGPIARAEDPAQPDFQFPQMVTPDLTPGWEPNLIDYLYVSFTNATAFSPTDAMPLSRRAKSLMALQSLASLVTVGLVVARAVNILQG